MALVAGGQGGEVVGRSSMVHGQHLEGRGVVVVVGADHDAAGHGLAAGGRLLAGEGGAELLDAAAALLAACGMIKVGGESGVRNRAGWKGRAGCEAGRWSPAG